MPGGTGDEVPVAATSKRLIRWPSKTSPLGCHHSGAMPAPPGLAGTDSVPVRNQVWRLFQVTAALVAATAVSSRPTPRPTAAAVDYQPQAEPDHGRVPVSVATVPSLTMTSRSA